MKRIISYLVSAVCAGTLALTGCSDDFLQKDSLTSISAATFWQTETDALNGLAACYDALQSTYLYNGDPWTAGPLNMDCMTDNGGHFNWSGWMAGYDICNGTHTASSWLVGSYWSACYEAIKRCNTLIHYIGNIDMDADLIEVYVAEATVLRALMYINLTMTYQDVPYITTVQSLSEAECPKTDRETIVQNIMSDLDAAADVLPVTPDARGRLTKGAALSLLGRVALYNEEWDTAISAYKEVVDLGVYSLYNDFDALFTEASEACDEIIFAVRFEGPGLNEGSSFMAHWNTPLEAMNGTVDMADAFYKTDGTPCTDTYVCGEGPDLWTVNSERYLDRDPRLYTTLFVPGVSTWGSSEALYGGAAASYSTIYVMKYFDGGNISYSTSWDCGQDFYVVRYAEVLLGLAEAYIEKGTNLSDAISLIDQVRARVNMPSVESVEGATSQSDLREVVRHERRVELAFEGLRLFDLYRWRLLEDAKDRINNEASTYGFWYEYRYHRGEMEYEWPLPLSEVDSNSQLVQNELWS